MTQNQPTVSPPAGDQKPFGMTVAEWQLAAGSANLGISSAAIYAMNIGLLEVTVLSAIGASLGLSVGVAVLVIATMEALGMPIPGKVVQTILDFVGGPFSIVGGTIGMGINGEQGFEQGTRLGGLFDLYNADRDAVTQLMGESSIAIKVLSGEAAVWANLSTFAPNALNFQPTQIPNTPNAPPPDATLKMQEITHQLVQLGSNSSVVRQSIPQSHTTNDDGDRWTHHNPQPLCAVVPQQVIKPITPIPPPNPASSVAAPASSPSLPGPLPKPTPLPTPNPGGGGSQSSNNYFFEQDDETPAKPFENSTEQDDAENGITLSLP
jgi:hypothetical protein